MNRYFIEVSYMGTGYAGFQIQDNAPTIQAEVERALEVFSKIKITLTGSSRTDTGVHAEQNYFHFDSEKEIHNEAAYNLNALLPAGIAVRSIRKVATVRHCRFDALWRQYRYVVYPQKDPFMNARGYYFPYGLDMERMKKAAEVIKEYSDFSSFAKRNSQVKTWNCSVLDSYWEQAPGYCLYRVRANRFLRGMVKGLVGTMLKVGRKKISLEEFHDIIRKGDSSFVDFAVPGYGLYLEKVEYGDEYFD